MPKVKIAESTQDNLKVATGFAKVVDNYGFGTARIKVIDSRLFNLEYGGRKIEEQNGIIAEVQTIRLTSKVEYFCQIINLSKSNVRCRLHRPLHNI